MGGGWLVGRIGTRAMHAMVSPKLNSTVCLHACRQVGLVYAGEAGGGGRGLRAGGAAGQALLPGLGGDSRLSQTPSQKRDHPCRRRSTASRR